jgi:AraC-like DNA-binding protein
MDASSLGRLLDQIHAFGPDLHAREPAALVLRLLREELAAKERSDEGLARALAETALAYLKRAAAGDDGSSGAVRTLAERRVKRAIALLEADLAERWTVERLAKAVGLSRPVLARELARTTGLSPHRYLTRRRMERAAERLRASDAGLAEIATRVGYVSEFAFGRAFKRFHGVSPGAFRRRATVPARAAIRMAA